MEGKRRKSKVIASCTYLQERFQEYAASEKECYGYECLNVRSRLENENQAAGSERTRREDKTCDVRFSLIRENWVFQKKLHKDSV